MFSEKIVDKEVLTIAFGSCNKQHKAQNFWSLIASHHPKIWIWLGDIIYADTEDMAQMKSMYDAQKNAPEYREFRKKLSVLGIWDDHDYGVNDGGSEYPKKDSSKLLLFDFLDVPESHFGYEHSGAYQSYLLKENGVDILIILLDARYFRDAQIPDPSGKKRYLDNSDGDLLGPEQWAWFESLIQQSEADYHFIGSGIQFIPTEHAYEKWSNYPKERQKLIDLLEKHDPSRTVLLSGDRHIGEISKMKTSMSQNYIYDITSSGLTHAYEQSSSTKEPNPYRVGDLQSQRNFGVLKIPKANQDWIDVEIWGMTDELLEYHRINFNED